MRVFVDTNVLLDMIRRGRIFYLLDIIYPL